MMCQQRRCVALLGLLGLGSSLMTPLRRPLPRRTVVATATLQSVKEAIGTIFVPPPPPLPTARVEGAELYRFLGVPPDAEFEEIQAATKKLKMKHEGDKKMGIKIDVTKEMISDLRLQQRLGGTLRVSAAVSMKDSKAAKFENKIVEVKRKSMVPGPIAAIPGMYRPFWVPPTVREEKRWQKEYVKQARNYFIALEVLGLVLPGVITGAQAAGVMVFGAHLSGRGRPPLKRGPTGQVAEVREEKPGGMVWSFGLVMFHFCLGRAFGHVMAPVLLFVRPKQSRFVFAVASMTFGSLVWQPYGTTSGGMKRQSKYKRGGNTD